MNSMQQMKDPAAGVPRELLPHLHLLSNNRYPVNNNPSLETIVAYLLEAPKVVREAQPVRWQFLECPPDGTLFLTWQPPDLGVNFASDGYVWSDQEQPFNSDVRGYTLQMFMHKSGFRPQAEAMAGHSRRRYRLLPPQQSMGGPMPDPSLWLIHYSKSAPRDHVAAASIPVAQPVHAQLQQRRMIMGAGALAKKEFMLHDRSNWPVINLPGGIARHPSAGQVGPNAHRRGQSLTGHEPTIEEEEDVSRGDALDFLTPREISRSRYEQHHEWMEEILESPYRTMQIVPPALGLGRKGELEALTRDFFDAPTGVQPEAGADAAVTRVGKLDAGKAEAFAHLANQKLANMQLELQKMKEAHQRRMGKLRKVTALSAAERRMRNAPSDFSQRKSLVNGSTTAGHADSDPIDEIVREVEATTGKKVERVKNVTCVSKGGYQELQASATPHPEQSQSQSASSSVKPNTSVPPTEPSQQPAPRQAQEQQPTSPSMRAPGQNGTSPQDSSLQSTAQAADEVEQPDGLSHEQDGLEEVGDADIDMAEMDDQPEVGDGLGDANEWVMVDDTNMDDHVDSTSLDNLTKSMVEDDQAEDQTPLNTGFTPGASANQTPQATGQLQQVTGSEQHPTGQTPLDTGDFDFDDVNTAGDALADYGADDDLNLDNMDDSAFGDAFHPTDDNDLS